MSDLGEISAEVIGAIDRLDRVLGRFRELDRARLAVIQAEMERDPKLRQEAALLARARVLIQQAGNSAAAARRAGGDWLAQHGSADSGGSGAWQAIGATPSTGPAGADGRAAFGSTVAQAAWVEGVHIPGGRVYFSAAEPGMRESAAALPPFPNEYVFAAHGRSDRVSVNGGELTAAEIAELIRADEGWNGRQVRLFACNTGRGENSIAADLATRLGVRVTAPDDFAWLAADGRFGVAPIRKTIVNGAVVELPDCGNRGSWRVFDPTPGA